MDRRVDLKLQRVKRGDDHRHIASEIGVVVEQDQEIDIAVRFRILPGLRPVQ